MSQIPSGITRLKTPSKIVKPIQGGGVVGTSQAPTPSVKPRGAATSSAAPTASTVQPRGSPLGSKVSQTTTGSVKRGAQASENSRLSVSRERLVSPRGSVTGMQIAQPRLPSRENSQTRLQYRRESSSSSLRGTSSKTDSTQPTVRRRSETSRSQENQASDSTKSSSLNLLKIGDRVLVGNVNPGVIAFIGETRFAKGDWAGVVLDEPVGKNNGSVQGFQYFDCQPAHGIFTKLEKLTKINQIPSDSQRLSGSGSTDYKTESKFKIGDRVVVSGSKHGVVRYVGETGFAKGEWAGVELDEPLGKNDGAVAGTRYFQCEPRYGLFGPLHKIVLSSLPLPARYQSQSPQENDTQNSLNTLGSNSSLSSVTSTQSGSSPTPKPVTASTVQTVSSPEPEFSEVKLSAGPSPSSGLSTSQLVALQASAMLKDASHYIVMKKEEALEEREKQIQSLLAEREFEQAEVASATSQVAKAEEEATRLKESHDKILLDKNKTIEELQLLVEAKEREKNEMQTQLDEERRKVEDLQFKLEEEEITLGDELRIEQKEIETLEIELKEKVASLLKLRKELEEEQDAKKTALLKVAELENDVSECNSQLWTLQTALTESNLKIREQETTLSGKLEGKSNDASIKEQELRNSYFEKIASLEKYLEEQNEGKKELENELKTTKTELVKLKEENDSLRKSVDDLTDRLHAKEDEFTSLCSELQVIKDTTLELQKQLHLSEVKSESLTADKNKLALVRVPGVYVLKALEREYRELTRVGNEERLGEALVRVNIKLFTSLEETEIAELAKNSGDSSQKLVYLNAQLREKDRALNELRSSSAESRIKIGQLSKDLAQAKELHDKDVQTLKKSCTEQTEAAENMVLKLKSELKESLLKGNDHQAELQNFKQVKEREFLIVKEEMKQQTERVNVLTQELISIKALQEKVTKEKNSLEVQQGKLDSDYQSAVQELGTVQGQLKSAEQAKGDTEKKYNDLVEKYSKLSSEHEKLVSANKDLVQEDNNAKEKYKLLCKEKERIEHLKFDVEAKLVEKSSQVVALEKEVEAAKYTSSSKDKELHLMSSSASDAEMMILKLRKEVDEAVKEKNKMMKNISGLIQEKEILQQSVDTFQVDLSGLQTEKLKLKEEVEKLRYQTDDLNSQLKESEIRESCAKEAADSEREALKQRLKNSESTVQHKDEAIASYKKEIDKLKKSSSDCRPTYTQSVQADVEAIASKLRKTEDLLATVEGEKISAEAQVDFLNSVIVDLQRKNEEHEKKIEMLITRNVSDTNGAMFDLHVDWRNKVRNELLEVPYVSDEDVTVTEVKVDVN